MKLWHIKLLCQLPRIHILNANSEPLYFVACKISTILCHLASVIFETISLGNISVIFETISLGNITLKYDISYNGKEEQTWRSKLKMQINQRMWNNQQ